MLLAQQVVLAAAILFTTALAACGEPSEGPEAGTRLEDVIKEPQQFMGRTVTVSADVSEIITSRSFRLGGEDTGGIGLLVFSAAGTQDLDDDDVVRVTGTVREIAYDTFREDFGFEARDDVRQSEGEAAIAASSVTVINETGGG